MNLSNEVIHNVIHPTAIFSLPTDVGSLEMRSNEDLDPMWADSQLNPKNRIDSLDPPKNPLWRVDGCAGLGTQFYAVPLFFDGFHPMRFDVFIPETATESPRMRRILNMDVVFHTRDRVRLQRQGICSYVLRVLQLWTLRMGLDEIEKLYHLRPFGSRIIFTNLSLKFEDVKVEVAFQHKVESSHKSICDLAQLWPGISMPTSVDIYDLIFVKQLHDSVCVVRYRDCGGTEKAGLWALKALTSSTSTKFMYHELRVLLTMPRHLNITSRPTALVTKKTTLNEKRKNVVGFLMPYHSGGGLRDELPILRLNNLLRVEDQVQWAIDICSALLHIREKANSYYPDLRLDQIVFPTDRKRPILVDFEQRGVWCEFGAPEINAIEYLVQLAAFVDEEFVDEEGDGLEANIRFGLDGTWPRPQRFRDIVKRLHPDYQKLRKANRPYDNPPEGYNIAWIYLTRKEQEHAEVYMLGRLLWCIFEGMSAPQQGAIWSSYHNDPEFDFPEFHRTPMILRGLIEECTKGRRDQLSNHVVRRGAKIVFRNDLRGDGTAEEIRLAAKDFWTKEVRWAEEFVLGREKAMAEGTWDLNHFGRPTLQEVHEILNKFQYAVGGVENGA